MKPLIKHTPGINGDMAMVQHFFWRYVFVSFEMGDPKIIPCWSTPHGDILAGLIGTFTMVSGFFLVMVDSQFNHRNL